MLFRFFVIYCSIICSSLSSSSQDPKHHEYCVIGAGPSGLQIGYFLHQAKRDYVIFEAAKRVGAFYERFPVHDQLISINKVYTGSNDTEFNLRHDWNSLITHLPLRFSNITRAFWPKRSEMLAYLDLYAKTHALNVQFEARLINIEQEDRHDADFQLFFENAQRYTCKYMIMAVGLWKPRVVETPYETINYADLESIDMEYFTDKDVLILGSGNSAMETAAKVGQVASKVQILSRNVLRLAFRTHYVGDIRAVNLHFLDTYQLKSLDFNIGFDSDDFQIKNLGVERDNNTGKWLFYDFFDEAVQADVIISCLGFKMNTSFWENSKTLASRLYEMDKDRKYPMMNVNYEAKQVPRLYFAGTLTHVMDFRKSSGGFIHGFRYTSRALARVMACEHHQEQWPAELITYDGLIDSIMARLASSSGLYQMFGQLGDVYIIDKSKLDQIVKLEEIPIGFMLTGHENFTKYTCWNLEKSAMILFVSFEYDKNFSGPDVDTIGAERSHSGHNFLHPVIRFKKHDREKFTFEMHLQEDLTTKFQSGRFFVEDFKKKFIDQVMYSLDEPDDGFGNLKWIKTVRNYSDISYTTFFTGRISPFENMFGQVDNDTEKYHDEL